MADVFISYSKVDRAIAESLADDLKARGFGVWWDFELYAGDDFHDMIRAEIAKAKAVVVIWSDTAVTSKWVRGEAVEASDHGTLISAHIPGFDARKVPINFRALHCEPVVNRARLITAIERKGAKASKSQTPQPAKRSRTAAATRPAVKGIVTSASTSGASSAIQQSIKRIHEASQVPPLAPPEYRQLFEIMAVEIKADNSIDAQTIENLLRRARESGLKLRRDDARFVMDVVSRADPWFEQGMSASLFASRFRNFVIARCRGQGIQLTTDELELIEAWFVGVAAPSDPPEIVPAAAQSTGAAGRVVPFPTRK